MPAPVPQEAAERAVELVLRGGRSERDAARETGLSRQTVGRFVERARAADGGVVVAAAVSVGEPARSLPPLPPLPEPVEAACAAGSLPDVEAHPVALASARDGVRRARALRVSLGANASLGDRQVAERLERDAVALLSRCEAAQEISPGEILRSTAWRRLERAIVEAAGTVPGAQRAIGEALARLAAEGV